MATETKKRNKKNVSDEIFVDIYNRSETAQAVATALGMTLANVYTRAKSLRKRAEANKATLNLKTFEGRKIDFQKLNSIANAALAATDPAKTFQEMTEEIEAAAS